MYYILISSLCVVMVFSVVVLLCYDVVKMSGEYGVRNRCARVNLDADAGAWNYGAFILMNRIKNQNVKKT